VDHAVLDAEGSVWSTENLIFLEMRFLNLQISVGDDQMTSKGVRAGEQA